MEKVYIVDAVRTPVAKARGAFAHSRPDDLLSHVLSGLMARQSQCDPGQIDEVIVGCAMPEGEQGMNVARIGTLLAGLPESVPAMTVNRFCASGLESIAIAAHRIQAGVADRVIAGGVESMTRVPMGGFHFSANPKFFKEDGAHLAIAYGMGLTAEIVAERYSVSAEQQVQFALQSHQRACAAQQSGDFSDEILPVAVRYTLPEKDVTHTVTQDEGPRADTSIDKMMKLRSPFHAKGSVTAATSSQMSDGAGAVLVVSEKALTEMGVEPLASFEAYRTAGIAPEIMGMGPVAAIEKLNEKDNIDVASMDWIELNEAFAAQAVAVINTLKLDPAKVNPYGGAIALGHPLGATGAVRTATLLHAMKRKNLKAGMVTMCIGTGMGAAGVFRR